ncbi:MAG: transposase, partial [Crocosphaera sp.]|nr:transposase [Crocosphaera sp.]
IDRDLNAAKNLEKLGQAMAEVTPVDRKEPTPLDEAGSKIDSNRVIISLKT